MTPKKKAKRGPGGPGDDPPGQIPPNLLIFARFDQKSAKIVAMEAAGGPPAKGKLLPVRLTDSTCQDYSIGTNEIVVAFHERDGSHLASWGQTGRPKVFVDMHGHGAKSAPQQSGGLIAPPRDERLIHVPVPEDAAYLAFYRTEVVPFVPPIEWDSDAAVDRDTSRGPVKHDLKATLLGLYWLSWDEDPMPPGGDLEPPGFELDLQELRLVDSILENIPGLGWQPTTMIVPGGKITLFDKIHGDGNIDTNLNIVILGDGFDASAEDQGLYQHRVDLVKEALQTTAPFSDYFDQTNIFVVYTESVHSGITDCPDAGPELVTYYVVRGAYGEVDYPGYLGSSATCLIYDAAQHFAPIDQIDVMLMLGKCPRYGGSAFVHEKVSFATLCETDIYKNNYPYAIGLEKFKNVCMHEIAHEIGNLGEEYIPWGECKIDELDHYENIVQRELMHAAPWRVIAHSDEIDPATEKFAVIRDCDTNSCDHMHNCLEPGDANPFPKLGLYWGAQYRYSDIDTSQYDPTPCVNNSSSQAKNFFRAMATCKMKKPDWDFCRWCNRLLSDAIERAIQS